MALPIIHCQCATGPAARRQSLPCAECMPHSMQRSGGAGHNLDLNHQMLSSNDRLHCLAHAVLQGFYLWRNLTPRLQVFRRSNEGPQRMSNSSLPGCPCQWWRVDLDGVLQHEDALEAVAW